MIGSIGLWRVIQREEHDGTRRYYIGEEDVRIVSGTVEKDGTFTASAGKEPLSFPRADFGDAAEIILHLLKKEQGEEAANTALVEASKAGKIIIKDVIADAFLQNTLLIPERIFRDRYLEPERRLYLRSISGDGRWHWHCSRC